MSKPAAQDVVKRMMAIDGLGNRDKGLRIKPILW
jgi:hypothetical protein